MSGVFASPVPGSIREENIMSNPLRLLRPDEPIAVGVIVINLQPELDGPDADDEQAAPYLNTEGDRITPAGSKWEITQHNVSDQWDIVCDLTGGWVCPTESELRDPTQYVLLVEDIPPPPVTLEQALDALRSLLSDVEASVYCGIPFSDPAHGFHESWVAARKALGVDSVFPR